MKVTLGPVALNDTSYDVKELHQALAALGSPVSKAESDQHKAGPDTQKKVRALQAKLGVPVDEARLVDDATANAIGQEMARQGLTAAGRSFTVSGTVLERDGTIRKRQRLIAFDLDLRGVAVYRTLKSTAQVDKNGGFELLGQATSDSEGRYSITFYDWQYGRAERKKADVVVYAIAQQKKGDGIIGYSRLLDSEDYSDKGIVRDLDVVIMRPDQRTEYEVLMASLTAFLKESETSLWRIATSYDQLAFVASELDVDARLVGVAAVAESLVNSNKDDRSKRQSHELLYGIGRQEIPLTWSDLHKKSTADLSAAIAQSVEKRIIRSFPEEAIVAFLKALAEMAVRNTLSDPANTPGTTLNSLLSNSLPEMEQRVAFATAVAGFTGTDPKEFWSKHLPAQPEFKDAPDLIPNLLVTQQLSMLTGHHAKLVTELHGKVNGSISKLLELETEDWLAILERTGVPDYVEGDDSMEKSRRYAARMQNILNAAFPTRRIALMLEKSMLPIEKVAVSRGLLNFLSQSATFDFATSRVHDFHGEIESAAGAHTEEVKTELKRIQRVFQVSTDPTAMKALLEHGLSSARDVAHVPRKSFIKTYAAALGGEAVAMAIHQRASHIAGRAEMSSLRMMDYSTGISPKVVVGPSEAATALAVLENQVPNYSELFGSPDLCECEECRSVYGAASYFVDLLRFLWRGEPNHDGKTPLDMLTPRRPDLVHLPLTCENTNTIIPYVDLANEVMEYYTANDSLANYEGYDTGDATQEELRANPQNFNLEAYRRLKDAKYPFTLPYHQPLDVIRTYSDFLGVSRYQALTAMNPTPDDATANAIAAESLRLSEEEYEVLVGKAFDGTPDGTPLYEFFGYGVAADLEKMSGVREFLQRSGVSYTDLVELVKTQFINPYQGTLDFLQEVLSYAAIDPNTAYTKLRQIDSGTLDPATDADITAALTAYNAAQGTSVTPAAFGEWVADHFSEFQQVITLYEPDSKCDLDTTSLRTVQSIYEGATTSGISDPSWSNIHRFIRLWKQLGWSIHETDLMLAALGAPELSPDTIRQLESILQLKDATKLAINQLAALWGSIDTYGDSSLYKKLFLSKSAQFDAAFQADAWGDYLQDSSEVLADHQSAILAAFRIREEDLTAILEVARIIDGGAERPLDPATDALSLPHLSTIYRHVVVAKALKLEISELCTLLQLFGMKPFSAWDVQQQRFTSVSPADTYEFYELAAATREAGFESEVLEYIVRGTLPADSSIGLDANDVLNAAREIRDALNGIELDYPDSPTSPLTVETLSAKLSLTFQSETVTRFMDVISGTATFEVITDDNLAVVIPEAMAGKVAYVKGSGRLTCIGVLSDADRDTLKGLAGINDNFQDSVEDLYAAPQTFLDDNFAGVFTNLVEAYATLLDHPAAVQPVELETKLDYVYACFVPVLKTKLRRDAMAQQVGALIGLGETATTLLIADEVDALIDDLSTPGFSATYYADPAFAAPALDRIDTTIDFDWSDGAPDPAVPADGFSARWTARISPPATGEYTLVADVAEADESFQLYLDDTRVLEKPAADAMISWEAVVTLNAAQMHLLRLDYVEVSQHAGIKLQWKTATTAQEILPSTSAYPAVILDRFQTYVTSWHRAAKFISGFALSDAELDHFLRFGTDFDNIDFGALTAAHWQRVNDYTALRNDVPQAQGLLTDLFAAANTANPAPTVADLKQQLYLATAWDTTSLDYLVDTYFALTTDDFKNEIALNRISDVMHIVSTTGLSAATIGDWGEAETDFDALNETAQLLKDTVKAKYEDEDWLQLAGNLSDTLRGHQRDALTGYLLTRPAIIAWGAEDADGLFEYFLIDVQMGACMDTSRIVQANASVQMFVNRCLLNMESEMSTGAEKGVSPGSIDRDRWDWMKNYRVWEANRKVFLYPENWLEPEWRVDRSEFFKDLESYLVQNDITDASVEQGFRNYLTSLNEVAHLEVCGICRENYPDGTLKYLHVFARTHNAPYKVFYRRWNEYRKWSAWEKVGVDVRCVEDGDYSGVHMIPVWWKNRLFLFWPEFLEKQDPIEQTSSTTTEDLAAGPVSSLEPGKYWEVRLAWSEYVDGTWSPKQVSKEFIKQEHENYMTNESALRFATEIDSDNMLTIYLISESPGPRYWYLDGWFELTDITSKVAADSGGAGGANEQWDQSYSTRFMDVSANSELELLGDTYLKNQTEHDLLLSPETANLDPAFEDPFFFSALQRTYFVRPVPIVVIKSVKDPGSYMPYLPGLVDDRLFRTRVPIPHPGPDDYMPGGKLPLGPDDTLPAELITLGKAPTSSTSYLIGATEAVSSNLLAMASGFMGNLSSRALDVTRAGAYDLQQTRNSYAFEGIDRPGDGVFTGFRFDTGLEFHTFYHPFSGQYIDNLNRDGINGLVESDTSITSDEGQTFVDAYDPNFDQGLVQKPADFDTRTYYKENVCFDVYGANSLYNWELFFHAPLYIATRLSKNGKFEEAMKWFHYIFDPTTDELPGPGDSEISRYWKVLPFKTTPAESLEDWFRTLAPNSNPNAEESTIAEWRDNPFDPHLVASNRPLAYMKHVVVKYVENLIAWGDSLFRQDTMESVNEALQIYVIANHILGPRPEFVPIRGEIQAESYDSLSAKWDDFSNALVELENIFPYSSATGVSTTSNGTTLLGVGTELYFCIPPNDKLLEYWDTVADRLFKIRNCQNIDGVERTLALFAPPIDPAALIQAASQGLSLGSILADLSTPPPIYRFTFLVQKANEFCADVRALGAALLAALEKKDAEELSRLRASQETQMLDLMTSIREHQVLDAKANKEALSKSRETAKFRLQYYSDLLGNETVTVPDEPELGSSLTADSALPSDTAIATIATDVDTSLVEADEGGVKIIPREKAEIDLGSTGLIFQGVATGMEGIAGTMNFIPTFSMNAEPLGVGPSVSFGGSNIAGGLSGLAKVPEIMSSIYNYQALLAGKMAAYIRREQDWTLQANLAAKEIIQLDKQITSADIRIQVAEKELENHLQEIDNAKAVEQFLKDKFTSQELYQWMKEQLLAVYKQSYNLAYDMAKKAEKAYKYEIGTETASFIQYGYWDSSMQGLAAGDKLQLALRQLEKSYLEENRRELELTKSVSLLRLNPQALIQLRETGTCYVSLPEELFDLDFRGHYFRRIKSVKLSIPCVAGPHTSVSCSLRLLNNSVRIDTSMNSQGTYEHENDEGLWIDDDRFRTSVVPVKSIATSTAQDDAGMFEFDFRDERYLPFEGAGAISEWEIELSADKELRQFDYSSISDVILQLSYAARESGGLFKENATTYIKDFLMNSADLTEQPLRQMFDMKHEFPNEWYKFLYPSGEGAEQILSVTLAPNRFPFFVQDREILVQKLEVFARCTGQTTYHGILSYVDQDGDPVTSAQITMGQNDAYGGLNTATLKVTDAGLDLEEIDLEQPFSIKLKRSSEPDYSSLVTAPEEEVNDLFVVLHYKLATS